MLPVPYPVDVIDSPELSSLERAFNPRRAPATDRASALVDSVASAIEAYERSTATRKRCRRPQDQVVFLNTTQAVVCDVIVSALSDDTSGIYVSRSHRDLAIESRYRDPTSSRQFPKILDAMSSEPLSIINQTIGGELEKGKRRRTVISIGEQLCDLASASCVSPEDFKVTPGGETIILKRPRYDYWDDGGYMNYVDTQETRKLRDELDRINGYLRTADLSLVGDPQRYIDLTDRQLRRTFTNGQFDSGGRMFGGYWQPMGKSQRLEHLFIDGEHVVEVDFGQIMPRLVYGKLDVAPIKADLYDIPGFEACRPGVKKVMSSMLFVRKRLKKMPKETRDHFPKHVTIEEVMSAIEAAHPAIKDAFFTGVGHYCQFLESQILVSVLLRLNRLGITALPIHDAVLVPASASELTQQVMLEMFHGQTGADGVVEVVGS